MLPLLRLLGPYVVWLYPIGVLILLVYLRAWLLASRDLRASLFTLEREMAVARMRRAATGAFAIFGALIGLFVVQFYVTRTMDISDVIRPTPTSEIIGRSQFLPTPGPTRDRTLEPLEPTMTPSPTSTRRPTPLPVVTSLPSPTPEPVDTPVPPALCPDPGVRIAQPGQGQNIQGRIDIRGTASIPGFQFYKVELGLGEHPGRWTSISDIHGTSVTDGLLEVWDTSDLPAGSYSLRLVVVDATGNFPPPCEVQVYVSH